jgi:hypothetical protein
VRPSQHNKGRRLQTPLHQLATQQGGNRGGIRRGTRSKTRSNSGADSRTCGGTCIGACGGPARCHPQQQLHSHLQHNL